MPKHISHSLAEINLPMIFPEPGEIDPAHADKLKRAGVGTGFVKFDIAVLQSASLRLPLEERGMMVQALLEACEAKQPNEDQRALLALFVSDSEEADNAS